MTKNYFYHGYQHPIWPKTDKNWVYFAHFRPKIDPKMVSYNITFTKKCFFMPPFHLFTQIRIILDYHVWDHFCTKQNLNKQIWVFWAKYQAKLFMKHSYYVLRDWLGKKGNSSPTIFLAHFLFGSKIKTTYPGVHTPI